MTDLLPTLAGEPDVVDRKGASHGDRTYKLHLDGYDQTALFSGKSATPKRTNIARGSRLDGSGRKGRRLATGDARTLQRSLVHATRIATRFRLVCAWSTHLESGGHVLL
jgi:hypothetical protein